MDTAAATAAAAMSTKPHGPLPLDPIWKGPDEYVESLLAFISTSTQFQNLCGGVHILDFLTREPSLYDSVLPQEWRDWFERVDVEDMLDLLLRVELPPSSSSSGNEDARAAAAAWDKLRCPPVSLVEYVRTVRRHSLKRELLLRGESEERTLPRHIAVGMKPKKVHEVTRFAAFVDELADTVKRRASEDRRTRPAEREQGILGQKQGDGDDDDDMHKDPVIIDFGSGQNYLGRTLVRSPYKKQVIAIEQRHHNVEGAKEMDVHAKLVKKEKNMVNKKDWKRQWNEKREIRNGTKPDLVDTPLDQPAVPDIDWAAIEDRIPFVTPAQGEAADASRLVQADSQTNQLLDSTPSLGFEHTPDGALTPATPASSGDRHPPPLSTALPPESILTTPSNSIQYVERELSDGNLGGIISPKSPSSIVVSIHSCGNLTHHGLRSLTLNPSVKAVAMIGCCYNLLTERLGPPTYKLPTLRSNHPRLEETSNAFDAHGFPMSKRLEQYESGLGASASNSVSSHGSSSDTTSPDAPSERGIRLNITARMMAVQAPHNWGPKDSQEFFTRHYYRAVLQRIFLDLGIVQMSSPQSQPEIQLAGGSLSGRDDAGAPLIIGSLRKACFGSFDAYVRGAMEKLSRDPSDGARVLEKARPLFENDGKMIAEYEARYAYAKKRLSVIWSLMAFSANVVESTIIVDRWLWLMEQEEVEDAWVEAVFDYKQSPRNMVVVGIKKQGT